MSILQEGAAVRYSGVGKGTITGFSDRGYPQVNRVTVAVLELEDGTIFNPHEHDMGEIRKISEECDRVEAARIANNTHVPTELILEPIGVSDSTIPLEEGSVVAHQLNMALVLMGTLKARCLEAGVPFDENDTEGTLEAYIQNRIDRS